MIVTSNKPFSGWGEIFGDEVVAAAMIDRLVHHDEILSLKGDSYRLRDKDVATRPAGASRARISPIAPIRAGVVALSGDLQPWRATAELWDPPKRALRARRRATLLCSGSVAARRAEVGPVSTGEGGSTFKR